MKPVLAAIALALIVTPALAGGIDMSTLTPTLTYPDPAPAPVTKGNAGIDK